MKKIPKEEMPDKLPIKEGRSSLLRLSLINLQIGEGLEVERGELRTQKPPYDIISRIKKKYGFRYKYGQNADGSGWLFKRVK